VGALLSEVAVTVAGLADGSFVVRKSSLPVHGSLDMPAGSM
jgi:hypothetical protein